MVAAVIIGTITIVWFLIYLLYGLMKKAVISGTMEALETYYKIHNETYEKNMIELGADIQAARKKQLEVDKRKEKREKKEAKKHKAVK
nr:hypothetical protein [uncultured Cellulosilyticum sp.]